MSSEKKAALMLHISSVIYTLIAVVLVVFTIMEFLDNPFLSEKDKGRIVLLLASTVLCMGAVIIVELMAAGLKAYRKWAWIGGLILFATYIPSLFIVLGIIGMMGLLKQETREKFSLENAPAPVAEKNSNEELPGKMPVKAEKPKLKLKAIYIISAVTALWLIFALSKIFFVPPRFPLN